MLIYAIATAMLVNDSLLHSAFVLVSARNFEIAAIHCLLVFQLMPSQQWAATTEGQPNAQPSADAAARSRAARPLARRRRRPLRRNGPV